SPPASIREAVFLPDGRRAISVNVGRALTLWNLETGQPVHQFEGHTAMIQCIALSADGRTLLSAGGQPTRQDGQTVHQGCEVRVWDVVSGKELRRFEGHDQTVHSVALSPDGSRAVSSSSMRQILWDVATGKEIRRLPGFPVARLAFGSDGRQ